MICLLGTAWTCTARLHAAEADRRPRPNIVLIMADDN
jgi:hypothetical protein